MKPDKITIHCSDSKNGERVDISEIRKWHLARGFADVGYHAVIQPDGELQRGRGLTSLGAHVEGNNDGNIGVCLVGKDKFTLAQFSSLRSFIDSLVQIYSIKEFEIYCHYEFDTAIKQGKTCPNMRNANIIAWYCAHDYDALKDYLL